MRTLDGYLSGKAQRLDPSALVYREEDGSYTLERRDEPPMSLGGSFGAARQALSAMRNAHAAE